MVSDQKLPMFFFPGDYAFLGGLAILATLIAAAWPAMQMVRKPPAALLEVFSNER